MTPRLPKVVFAPCSIDQDGFVPFTLIVVRRPELRSPTDQTTDHGDKRLALTIEAYHVDDPLDEVTLQRVPCFQTVVWCSADERDQWDRGTGGALGRPRSNTSGPVRQYLTVDAPKVERAIVQARAELARKAPLPPVHERVRVAVQRLDGGAQRGGQKAVSEVLATLWGVDVDVAEKALQRFLKDGTTSAKRLMDILTVLGFEVAESFHTPAMPAVDYGKLANDSAEEAEGWIEGVEDLRQDFDRGQATYPDVKTAARYAASLADLTKDAAEWAALAARQTPYNPANVQVAAEAVEKTAGHAKMATKLVQDLTDRFAER